MYRLDTSTPRGGGRRRARVRHPRSAAPVADARVRAAQAARAGARRAAQHLLRVALSRPQADARGRAHQHRRARPARAAARRRTAAHRPARQGRLHDHRRGQGTVPRAGLRHPAGGLRRRRALRRPAGVLPAHGLGRAAAHPRGTPPDRRAPARGPAVLAGPDPGTARPLHARAPAPRPGVGGPRGPLALGADRQRAPGGVGARTAPRSRRRRSPKPPAGNRRAAIRRAPPDQRAACPSRRRQRTARGPTPRDHRGPGEGEVHGNRQGRHRRSRQLRRLAGAGRALLPRRGRVRVRAGPDARALRGLPRLRHRVRRRVRRRRQEGRP